MQEPKVSILIPLYNSESFIEATIASAQGQTWGNTEIIIVDDGSTDDSYKIAKSFESDKIHVYQQENKGACAARNLAFEKSTGDYFQYLDADDLLSEDKIAEQMKLFQKYGNEIVVSGQWDRFYDDTSEAVFPKRLLNKDWDNPIEWLINSWEGKGMMAQHAWLIPKALIEKTGRWDERLRINQDGEFFNRVLMHAKRIKHSERAKVYYRSGNMDSISRKPSRDKAESLLLSFQLYVQNTLPVLDNKITRHALMMNFLRFIYQYNGLYPDLAYKAREEIKTLGYVKLPPFGGGTFKKLAQLVGFENALRIRKLMKGF